MQKSRFITIGLGPVGRALTLGLAQAGHKPGLLVGRGRTKERYFAKRLGTKLVTALPEDIENVDFILLAMQTSLVPSYAAELCRKSLPWKNLTFVHLAGSLGIAPLSPLAKKGSGVAAIHPYQTFPKEQKAVNLSGIYYGVTGNRKGNGLARQLVRDLNGHSVVIREEDRMLYHLSAILACTFVAADIELAATVLESLGWPAQRALAATTQIAEETIRNIKELGIRTAMTGPQKRGDRALIRRHLKELHQRLPEFENIYRVVSEAIIRQTDARSKTPSRTR